VCQLECTPTTHIRLGIMFNAFCIVHVHMQGKFYSGLSEKCEVLSLYALCRKLHIGHFHAIPLHFICYNIADTMQIGCKFQNCTVGCWRETFKGFHGNFNLHTKLGCHNLFMVVCYTLVRPFPDPWKHLFLTVWRMGVRR